MHAAPRRPTRPSFLREPPTHIRCVRVSWLDDDGLFAHCLDAKGRRYVIDARSAVSLPALSEGQRITVEAYASGLVRALVFDAFDGAALRPAARQPWPGGTG